MTVKPFLISNNTPNTIHKILQTVVYIEDGVIYGYHGHGGWGLGLVFTESFNGLQWSLRFSRDQLLVTTFLFLSVYRNL